MKDGGPLDMEPGELGTGLTEPAPRSFGAPMTDGAPTLVRGSGGLPSLVDHDTELATGADHAAPLDDTVLGRVFAGRYHVRSEVAEGGMATVYLATDLQSKKDVALKVMHPELTRERGFAVRFKREAAFAARLDHPGIVRVLDHGMEGHLFFLVMDLLDGCDIFSVLHRRKRLEADVARRIVIDVCDALAAAHALNIVHRDLKPENVFLRRVDDGVRVMVLDFGVAKMVAPDERGADDADTALTAVGTLLGTPEYLSPEMCLGEPVGPQADVYACGVLLFALLTGRPPFVTERPIEVTQKHIAEEPLPPSWFLPGLEPAIDAIVLKALAKQPADRHAGARALADALRAVGPAPPVPPALLVTAPVDGEQKHSPNAPTLAVPNAVPRSADTQPGQDGGHRPGEAGDAMTEAARPSPLPLTTRGTVPAQQGQRATLVVVALVALAATFAAGFAAGRASAPSAPSAPVPTHVSP